MSLEVILRSPRNLVAQASTLKETRYSSKRAKSTNRAGLQYERSHYFREARADEKHSRMKPNFSSLATKTIDGMMLPVRVWNNTQFRSLNNRRPRHNVVSLLYLLSLKHSCLVAKRWKNIEVLLLRNESLLSICWKPGWPYSIHPPWYYNDSFSIYFPSLLSNILELYTYYDCTWM